MKPTPSEMTAYVTLFSGAGDGLGIASAATLVDLVDRSLSLGAGFLDTAGVTVAESTIGASKADVGGVLTDSVAVAGGGPVGLYVHPSLSLSQNHASPGQLASIFVDPIATASTGTQSLGAVHGLYVHSGSGAAAISTAAYGVYVKNPVAGVANYSAYFEGKVGINTPTPTAQLDVNGSISGTSLTGPLSTAVQPNITELPAATLLGSVVVSGAALSSVTTINSIPAALATTSANGFMSSTDKTKLDGLGNDADYVLRDGTRSMTGSFNLGTNAITNVTTLNGITMTPSGNPASVGTSNSAGVATTYARLDHVHDHGSQAGGSLHADASGVSSGFMSAADKTKLDTFGTETDYVLRDGTRAMTGSLSLGTNAITNVTTLNGITMTPSGNPASVGTSNSAGVATTYARLDHVHDHGAQAGGNLHAEASALAAGFMSAADKVKLDGVTSTASYEQVSQNLGDYDKAFGYTGDDLTTITYTKSGDTIVKTFNYTGGKLTSMVLSGDTPGGIPLTKTFVYTGDSLTSIAYT